MQLQSGLLTIGRWLKLPRYIPLCISHVHNHISFHSNIALKCQPMLEAPSNGTIQCDTQAVGGTCTFNCDEGFTLRGSEIRTCTPSLQWTGRPTVCDPPMCPALRPLSNGFVSFPCTREEGDTCSVTCAHGYNITGPDVQKCITVGDDLMWSEGPECVGENFGL